LYTLLSATIVVIKFLSETEYKKKMRLYLLLLLSSLNLVIVVGSAAHDKGFGALLSILLFQGTLVEVPSDVELADFDLSTQSAGMLQLDVGLTIEGIDLSALSPNDFSILQGAVATAIKEAVPIYGSECSIPVLKVIEAEDSSVAMVGAEATVTAGVGAAVAAVAETYIHSTLEQSSLLSILATDFADALYLHSGAALTDRLAEAVAVSPFEATFQNLSLVTKPDVTAYIERLPSMAPTVLPYIVEGSALSLSLIIVIGVVVDSCLLVTCCVTIYLTSRHYMRRRRERDLPQPVYSNTETVITPAEISAAGGQVSTAPIESEPPVILPPSSDLSVLDLEANTIVSDDVDLVLSPMSRERAMSAKTRRSIRSDASDLDLRLSLAMVSIRPGTATLLDTPTSKLSAQSGSAEDLESGSSHGFRNNEINDGV
jgi:hypothetical protein